MQTLKSRRSRAFAEAAGKEKRPLAVLFAVSAAARPVSGSCQNKKMCYNNKKSKSRKNHKQQDVHR